jgi:hypothetical protein
MSLFIAEDGSALENLCLLDDGVEASAWLGSRLGVGAVCAAAFLRGGGGGGEVIQVVSTYLGGRGLKESVCLLGGTGGRWLSSMVVELERRSEDLLQSLSISPRQPPSYFPTYPAVYHTPAMSPPDTRDL